MIQVGRMQGFELLLGSDVAYSLKALPSLFKAASLLLSKQPHSVFLLGYVSRCAPGTCLSVFTCKHAKRRKSQEREDRQN